MSLSDRCISCGAHDSLVFERSSGYAGYRCDKCNKWIYATQYMSNKAHLTAISRKKLSTPAKYLLDNNLIVGRALDYGCGRGFDADSLHMDKYDPHYFPTYPEGSYDTIMCNYVLNVIPEDDIRKLVIANIALLLQPTGTAYLSVRNDAANLKGWTQRETWQGLIELPYNVVVKNSNFTMYSMTLDEYGSKK